MMIPKHHFELNFTLYLESDNACDVFPLVPDHHDIAEEGHLPLDVVLDGHWGHVLTSGGDDQLWG